MEQVIKKITEQELPALMAVTNLLIDHPVVSENGTVFAGLGVVKEMVEKIWESLESVTPDVIIAVVGRESTMANLPEGVNDASKDWSLRRGARVSRVEEASAR